MEKWNFDDNFTMDIVVNCLLMALLVSLYIGFVQDKYWKYNNEYREFKNLLYISILFMITGTLFKLGLMYEWNNAIMLLLISLYSLFGEFVFVPSIFLAVSLINENKEEKILTGKSRKRLLIFLVVIDILIQTIIVLHQILIMNVSYHFDDIDIMMMVVNTLINGVVLMYIIINNRKWFNRGELKIIIVISIIPILMSFQDMWDGLIINICIVGMVYVIYMWILEVRRIEFIKEKEIIEKNKREIEQANIAIMMSQIQPHFLYNTLTTIASLCKINPDSAQKVTIDFAKYLHVNMHSIKQRELIWFEEELKHVKTYLEIEKIRFGERIEIISEINCCNFKVPSLSLQPVVENAVKHGICNRKEGGKITIRTSETDKEWLIEVIDTGMGFDEKTVNWEDGDHIGIMNVKSRLKDQCGGSMIIKSEVNVGTEVKILIPKEKIQ